MSNNRFGRAVRDLLRRRELRRLPVHPDLAQLRRQAKELLRAVRAGDDDAYSELRYWHPTPPARDAAKLADAQLAFARSYGASSWTRVVQSCTLIDAIWDNDIDGVRRLISANPHLLFEDAGIRNVNWGPPMSYAANVGRDEIVAMLFAMGATDGAHAIDRAVLQGRISTARLLHNALGRPTPPADAFGGAAYTLNVQGTELLFELGATLPVVDERTTAPVDVVIDSDSRAPARKHRILDLYAQHGFVFPDTPTMAIHRGRLDLLEAHVARDPSLLSRTFTYDEISPASLGCGQPKRDGYDERLPRTPIAGGTLLHMCVEFDELDIARWLLARGMDPNIQARVDANGFGGHTALFNAVVSYPYFWMNFTGGWAHSRKPENTDFASLLLEAGARMDVRASFREADNSLLGPRFHDYRDVTPVQWGERYRNRMVVSEPVLRLLRERGRAE
jgi:ankyrin repeat protein